MYIKKGWMLCAVAAAVCACETYTPDTAVPVTDESAEIAAIQEHSYVQGVSVVEFSDETAARLEAGDTSPLDAMGIVGAERVFKDFGEFDALSRAEGLHRFYRVTFAKVMPVTKAMSAFGSSADVLGVDPVRRVKRRAVFNDPYLSRQWNMISSRSGADINVSSVWQNYTTGSSNVIVAVVDEAIDSSHEDLSANMWDDGAGHHGYNFVTGSYTQTLSGRSDTGHGTHVAGVISAVNNNGVGVSGIAGGDAAAGIAGVRVMSCQIFAGMDSADDDECAEAIRWGATHGAVISQNSWGYMADEDEDGEVSSTELAAYKKVSIPKVIKKAVEYFNKYAGCDDSGRQRLDSPMKGGLVIFAAGNEDIDYDPICDDDSVIAVAATGPDGTKASYSNYGSWVDVCAPGGDGRSDIWSTVPKFVASSGYAGTDWQGTSMACPHVSGAAALAISYYGAQGFTAEKLRKAIEGSARTVGGSDPIGGMIDVKALFEDLGNHPPVVSSEPDDLKYTSSNRTSKNLAEIFSDEDGDELQYTAQSSDETIVKASISAGRLYLEPVSYGQCTITVTATDGMSEPVVTTFEMVVWDSASHVQASSQVEDGELSVRIADEEYQDVHIEIISSTGAVVYDTWKVCSVFDPATVYVPGIAPGVYAIRITYGGHSYTKTFVKS